MTMLFRMCTAILLILISFEARGAEVVCHMTYAEGDSGPATAERGNKNFLTRWPSGALPTPSTCKIGLIRGPIIKGDYEKVLAFCRQNHPFLDTFLLQSPGGDVVDAIKIGTLFRKYLIVAEAPVHFNPPSPWPDTLAGYRRAGDTEGPVCRGADCVCASACALIWFGGAERSGSVGLHRPYFSEESAFKLLSPADAEKEYTKMLTSIGDFLEEMEVPKPIIETMTATGSAEITWIQDQSDNRPPGLTEWKDASCGHFTDQEYNTMLHLQDKVLQKNASSDEELLYRELFGKQFSKYSCERDLMSKTRDSMLAPNIDLPDFSGQGVPVQ